MSRNKLAAALRPSADGLSLSGMNKSLKISCVFLFLFVLFGVLVNNASAHQPRLVYDLKSTPKEPFIIYDGTDVSRAFYGLLKGQPDYYKFVLDKPADIYLGLLVPDIKNTQTNVSANIYSVKADKTILKYKLDAASSKWETFYENYGGDNYFKGPEMTKNLPADTYIVEVVNPNNLGEYVLAVGTEESFPLKEMFKAFVNASSLKRDFFNKSFFAIFEGKIGGYLMGMLIALILIIVLAVFGFKRIRIKKVINNQLKTEV